MGALRIILALAVVIGHSSPLFGFSLVGGKIAVQAFYIISGFYMSMILTEKYREQKNSYWLFMSNRLIRLYPIYWVICIIACILAFYNYVKSDHQFMGVLQVYKDHSSHMGIFSFVYLIFSNIFLIGQDIAMFLGLDTNTGNLFFTSNCHNTDPKLYTFLLVPQAWTVGVEILFYIIAPFIVRRNIYVVLSLILFSLLTRFLLSSNGLNHDPWTYRFFPSELVFFLMGNLSYKFLCWLRKHEISRIYGLCIMIFMLLFTFFYANIPLPGKFYVYVICVMISIPFVFLYSKNLKVDAWVGELSYPVYMGHMLLFAAVLPKLSFLSPLGNGVVLSVISILFAALLNMAVGAPIEKFRQRRVKKAALLTLRN